MSFYANNNLAKKEFNFTDNFFWIFSYFQSFLMPLFQNPYSAFGKNNN